jgi:type III restriction enzyme
VRLTLRPFQEHAVDELGKLLDAARYGYRVAGKDQAVGLSATTGAGKTVIATALIERIIFGTDDGGIAPDPNAAFLWMTDLPQLNTQTRDKMIAGSSLLGPDRLLVIENTFDEASMAPGRVYFLNTQKLGIKGALVGEPSPKHSYPFWDTVKTTIETPGWTLYLVVDEAHRGMAEGKDRDDANSIIQRFIKGIPDVMPPVPIVLGISATPERYTRVVGDSGRTVGQHAVPPEGVRESGLIKELIIAKVAGEKQTDAMALLPEAAEAWKQSTEQWAAYCVAAEEEQLVVPAFIVQVENEDNGAATKTDLAAVIRVLTDTIGALPDAAFAHSFGEGTEIPGGTRKIRYLEPSRITEDPDARVIFFKTSLGTGWDCPRAEVMFSFRKAVDATSIAQTIGRMVRTPLARRIEEDERLNSAHVFLPHYNKAAVLSIIDYLRASGDSAVADSMSMGGSVVSLPRRAGVEAAVAAIEAVPSYLVPVARARQEVRRLIDLARSLSTHGVDLDAFANERAGLAALLETKRAELAMDPGFIKAVNDQGEIVIDRVEWAVGEALIATEKTLTIPASEDSIRLIFAGAKRALGGETAVAYWKARVAADATTANTARLEAYALSAKPEVMTALNNHASARIATLFTAYGPRGGQILRFQSRGEAVVFVDEPAEQVPPANITRTDGDRVPRFGQRRAEGEGAMGALPVVVLGVDAERLVELSSTKDECPVEALGPDRLDHALGVRVGVRRPEGRSDHPHPLRAEHRVERPTVLGVPVADEKPDCR